MIRRMILWMLVLPPMAMVWAQAPSDQDYANISLDSLLSLETVTATQKAQKISQAPAVMSVLTAEDLQNLGVQNLYEALGTMAGVTITESYFGISMVNIRGVLESNYNNKVLLLINGHPAYEVINGGFHLEFIPIHLVERIEVIRGPGSALYGTNAFAGVINIITKMADKEVYAGGGSFGTTEGGIAYGEKKDDRSFVLGASVRDSGGFPFRVVRDEQGMSGSFDYQNDVANGFAALRLRDWTFNLAYFDQTKEKFGITPVLAYNGVSDFKGGFFDALWQHAVSSGVTLSGRFRYDRMDRDMDIGHFPYDGFDGHADASTEMITRGDLVAGEFKADVVFSPRFSLLSGLVFEHLTTDPYWFKFKDGDGIHPYTAYSRSYDTDDTSVFSQALYQASEKVSLVVGFRAGDNSDSGSSFAPRAGIVYALSDATSLKLLYGDAYRNPNFFEKYVATYNVLYGAKDLRPERIRNVDLVLDRTFDSLSLRLDAFYLKTYDLITRVPTTRPDVEGAQAADYINGEGERNWGLEAELHGVLGRQITYFLSYAYTRGKLVSSDSDDPFIAEHSGSLGLSWKVLPSLYLHPNLQVISSQGAVGGYALYNLAIVVPISDRFSFSVEGRNLSDKQYDYPEYLRNKIPSIPGGPGRAVYGKLTLEF